MAKLKILHVSSSYWPAFEFGGPIQSVYLLNKFLAKKGVDVSVYTTNAGLKKNKEILLKKEVILDGVKVFYFPYFGYRHYNFSPDMFWYLARHLKDFDLVHITGVWNFPVFAAAFWARFFKKPYLISPRGSLMKEPLGMKRPLLKQIYLSSIAKGYFEKATAVHFTVEAEKKEYSEVGLSFQKAIIIPNSIETEPFSITNQNSGNFRKKFKIAADAKIILFLGRINWKKGFDALIPAFAEVIKKEPRAVLLIVGPKEEYQKTVEGLISEHDLGNKVVFTGMLVGKEKATAYRTANVFTLPSYSENFGMTVAEAMYFGSAETAVVITEKTGISSYVKKADAGLVIKKNVNELAAAIMEILENPEKTKKMSERGRKLVESEFSPESVAEKFIAEYNKLL